MFNSFNKQDLKLSMRKSQLTSSDTFFIVWIMCLICSFVSMVITHGSCLDGIVCANGNDKFMDFFNHIQYVRINGHYNVYQASVHACFPPLIYFMYYIFGLILPEDAIVIQSASQVSSYALLLYLWYCVIVGILLCYSIMRLAKKIKTNHTIGTILAVVTSNIYIFGILERGNSAVIVMILIIWFYIYKDDKSIVKREIALILVALAAGIKIYPAVIGLIYLVEKRYHEAFRLIIYGVIIFFLPFLFFGGWSAISTLLYNQNAVQSIETQSLSSIKMIPNGISSRNTAIIIDILYFMLAIFSLYINKNEWKRYFILSSIMILCPFWSGGYTRIYLTLPLLLFLETDGLGIRTHVNACMFAFIFALFTLNPSTISEKTHFSLAEWVGYVPIYLINLEIIIESIIMFFKKVKTKE